MTAAADDGTTTTAPTTTEAPTTTDAPTTSVAPSTTDAPTTTAPSTTAAPTTSTTPATTTVVPTTTAAPATTTTVVHRADDDRPGDDDDRTAADRLAATLAAPAVPAPTCRVSMTVKLGTRWAIRRAAWRPACSSTATGSPGPDDNFDSTAITALKNFQTKYGLTADGVAAKPTLQQLGIWVEPTVYPAATCHIYIAVRLGTLNDPARCVETRLRQIGYWLSGPDANFDATAVTALKAFQTKVGLLADGIAGTATLQALGVWVVATDAAAGRLHHPVAGAIPATSACPLAASRPAFASSAIRWRARTTASTRPPWPPFARSRIARVWRSPGGPTSRRWSAWGSGPPIRSRPPRCKVHISVRLGSNGVSARCVEQRLAQLGFAVTADLTFDAGVRRRACARSSTATGCSPTGWPARTTLSRLGIYDPNPPPATAVPENSGTGRRIVYSRAQQRIWAVNANGVVENTHRVSGRLHEPYAGTYYVYSRSQYTYSASDPSVRWRYMVRFAYGPDGGRIGFHEIPNRNGVPLQSAEQLGLPLVARLRAPVDRRRAVDLELGADRHEGRRPVAIVPDISVVVLTMGDRPEGLRGRGRQRPASAGRRCRGGGRRQRRRDDRALGIEGVVAVEAEHNLGVPGGRNLGAAHAAAPLLAFLDDDARFVDDEVLARCATAFERASRARRRRPAHRRRTGSDRPPARATRRGTRRRPVGRGDGVPRRRGRDPCRRLRRRRRLPRGLHLRDGGDRFGAAAGRPRLDDPIRRLVRRCSTRRPSPAAMPSRRAHDAQPGVARPPEPTGRARGLYVLDWLVISAGARPAPRGRPGPRRHSGLAHPAGSAAADRLVEPLPGSPSRTSAGRLTRTRWA